MREQDKILLWFYWEPPTILSSHHERNIGFTNGSLFFRMRRGWAIWGCTTPVWRSIALIFDNEVCEVQCITNPILLAGVLVLVLESPNLGWALVPINIFGTPWASGRKLSVKLRGHGAVYRKDTYVWHCGSMRHIFPFLSGAPYKTKWDEKTPVEP